MNTLSLRVRYRPLRIGWCIREDDFAALRNAVRQNFTIWGGFYNPLIPIEDLDMARRLVRTFRVDVLWPASQDQEISKFIAQNFPYLPNPLFAESMFTYSSGRRDPVLLDILHPMRKMYDDFFRNNPNPSVSINIYEWQTEDPLADLLLFSRGAVPPARETGVDYFELLRRDLAAKTVLIDKEVAIPVIASNERPVSLFSRFNLRRHYSVPKGADGSGFYVGSASDFKDLVTFWNLRATDMALMFFDPLHATRQEAVRARWLQTLHSRPKRSSPPDLTSIWYRKGSVPDLTMFDGSTVRYEIDNSWWGGEGLKASYPFFSEGSTLGSVSESSTGEPMVAFQLPEKPFEPDDALFHRHLVAAIDPGIGLFDNENATLSTPFIPELNEYYGRNCAFQWDAARAEPESLGLIINASRSDLSLKGMNVADLVGHMLRLDGIVAEPSRPGLIASRLIQQMGGLSGCRAFKIAGVRHLIESHRPDQPFVRSHAIQTIRAENTDHPISLYENLYIEPRKVGAALDAQSVFSHLLKKGIFRAGLRFECPACRLEFWTSLDDVQTHTICEYCGNEFNVTPQLRDRDWAFRRSGLFGPNDHQEGAIPVVLTLQQLETTVGRSDFLYTTAMTLLSADGAFRPCETDFVAVVPRPSQDSIEIAIGECKTREEITDDDVAKLREVADRIRRDPFRIFIVFSKLAAFSPQEIERARQLNDRYRRREILLTARELEPYHMYDRTKLEFDIDDIVIDFDDMAEVTNKVFFSRPAGGS
jgi:hypothetical protein